MKEFFRNFKKQRTVGLLNICSLSLGIMVAIVVGMWAINELSFDRFHKNKDRIYRPIFSFSQNGNPFTSSGMFRLFGEQAFDAFPVIEDMCRVELSKPDIVINATLYPSTLSLMVDPNFFSFFTFSLKEGDPGQVLSAPDRIVISESAVKRFFPEQDVIGQVIKRDGVDFTVSGVMKDMPKNSSFQTDFIVPFFGWKATSEWGNYDGFLTYFLLQKGVIIADLEESLKQMTYKSFAPFKEIESTFSLESLSDMHFSSIMHYDSHFNKGNKSLIMVFVLTALVILVISCINFSNLFVSTAFIRAKAIGIKKTIGAKKRRLVRDFYMETACYVLIAICAGIALTGLTMPVFNNFTQSNLTLDFNSPQLYLFLTGLFVFVVLLAGSFPALYMTRFNPLETLTGKFKGKKTSFLQKSLVVFQFAASIALLIVVMFMQKQLNHIISYDLGFDKNHVMYVQGRQLFEQNFKTLESELLAEPTITAVARKNALLSDWTQGWGIKKVPSDNAPSVIMEICRVSPNYFEFFDMKMIAGKNPFHYESSAETDVVINESAAQLLGYEQPVGELLVNDSGNRFTIQGVIRNAYTKSLHQDTGPQVYMKLTSERWNHIFFKINGDPQRAIAFAGQKWQEREAGYPFAYRFLDETYQQLYTSEMNASRVFAFAMLITLMITVAGLFAMAYYATHRRLKEVTIRKIYGASLKDIFILLNKSFLLWVAIAFTIACPVAYYSLYKWLSGFVIKTSLSVWVFLLVGAIALLITLLTSGYQTWKVATENPVNAIKND